MLRYYLYIYLVIILLVLTIPITLRFKCSRHKEDAHLTVCWRPFGLTPLWKLELPVVKLKFDGLAPILKIIGELEAVHQKPVVKKEAEIKPSPWYKFPKIVKLTPALTMAFFKMVSINKKFLKHVYCKKFYWRTEFGFDDASLTGFTAGMLWAVKSIVYRVLSININMNPDKDRLRVVPNFEQPGLRLDFDCILAVRLGHIIIAGLRILALVIPFVFKTVQLKGVRVWQKIIQLNH